MRDAYLLSLAMRPGLVTGDDPESLPAAPGAYLLLARLSMPLSLRIRTLPSVVLVAGRYVYAGSARGPGGIRARVARHLRRGKRPHWHVDQLSEAAAELQAIGVPGGDECALIGALLAAGGCEVALAGFGSTDCRTCRGHLLRLHGRAWWGTPRPGCARPPPCGT